MNEKMKLKSLGVLQETERSTNQDVTLSETAGFLSRRFLLLASRVRSPPR